MIADNLCKAGVEKKLMVNYTWFKIKFIVSKQSKDFNAYLM